jgi:tetratricopeptide (TPR) repeat protein
MFCGQTEAARNDLARALRLKPDHPEALALESVIATVHNQPNRALELALKAQEKNPRSLAALLALSYAKQALFTLPEALEAAKQATRAAPQSVLAWSQLARLQLVFRNLDEATDAARKAVEIDPHRSQTYTTLGFVHLTGLKIDAARRAFEKAIELDRSAAPLPRFGLGLVKIRKGDLREGRRQLEIAANLDPGNAMIRSYLGKAYEEKRNSLAETQFKLSKQFDENDPTPWFYSAILQQSQNRPVDALNELQSAIDLNDNRDLYTQLDLPAHLNLTVAASYEEFKSSYTNTDRFGPKFGLTWEASNNLSLRIAYIESLVRPLALDQTDSDSRV